MQLQGNKTADHVATPDQIVLGQLDRDEVWRIASSVAETAQQVCCLFSGLRSSL
jgi:hypothetical protein